MAKEFQFLHWNVDEKSDQRIPEHKMNALTLLSGLLHAKKGVNGNLHPQATMNLNV